MRALLALTLAVLPACGGVKRPASAPSAPLPESRATRGEAGPAKAAAPSRLTPFISSSWPLAGAVRGEDAMVVSAHPLASTVGADILRHGGNAIDAAVAVGFALAVVQPIAGNIGGGGFMVIRLHDGSVRALDYREVAPGRATSTMYVDSAGNVSETSLTGHLSVGVPGSVAGMFEAHRKFGRLPWAQVLAPAVALARDGHLLDATRSRNIVPEAARLARFPASRAQFLPSGDAPPPPGTIFVQRELGATLQLLADSGPAPFYRGSIADLLVQEMERGGGLVTKRDLAGYRPKWRDPIRITYRGYSIYTMPPPGGGVTLAEILNVMEGYATLPPFGSAALMHLQAEAMRRAFIDRNRYLGDPDVVTIPMERLLSKQYAATLRGEIDLEHATPSPPLPSRPEGTETTHYSVVDAEGNAVSCTTTLNNDFGSAVTVTGAGFLLNDEMDDFTAAPGKPNLFGLVQGATNAIAPGKRMLSAMTPAIVLDSSGAVLMVLGSPGGSRITTAVYQVISNVLDQGMTLGDAVAAPRLHHQALPDLIHIEQDGFLQSSLDSLEAMGHILEVWRYKTGVNAIARSGGGWVGVADPRRGGGAVGY